jgi:hypothetical protein
MMNITTLIGSVGFALFLGLMVYSYRQGERRMFPQPHSGYARDAGYTGTRRLFFPTASPHPATLSGSFRLASGACSDRLDHVGTRTAEAAKAASGDAVKVNHRPSQGQNARTIERMPAPMPNHNPRNLLIR